MHGRKQRGDKVEGLRGQEGRGNGEGGRFKKTRRKCKRARRKG